MIEKIEPVGLLIGNCLLPGETKADGVYPGHPNGIPVSQNRWLLVFATRGFRFVDDDRSIVYQLREGSPGGRLIKEGFLARTFEGWDPFGEGKCYVKQHGSPVAFGVPKGARVQNGIPLHANLFAVKWRIVGIDRGQAEAGCRALKPDKARGALGRDMRTMGVEWAQFRLNEREDDIEIVQAVQPFRQTGCEGQGSFCQPCGGGSVAWMNQAFVQPIPFNEACTEWVDCNHFDGSRIAAIKHRYNPKTERYEWVQTGPLAGREGEGFLETSTVAWNGAWLIAARREIPAQWGSGHAGVAWLRARDPFVKIDQWVQQESPPSGFPRTAYRCADGMLRLFTKDPSTPDSPTSGRGPNAMRCWDIDPENFSPSTPRVVFDAAGFGLPMRVEHGPVVDMCKLLPHAGGRVQYLVHRVRPAPIAYPIRNLPAVNEEEMACAGIYYEKIHYSEDYPALWKYE